MSASSQRLFRTAAVEHHRQRLLGAVLLPTTKATNASVFLLLILVLIGIAGLAVGSYPRRQHVRGHIVPQHGVARLYATQAGVVEAIFVREGEPVVVGQPLVTVASQQRIANGGSVHTALTEALDARVRETELRLKLVARQATDEQKQLNARIDNLAKERQAAERQQLLQDELVNLTHKRVATLRRLRLEALGSQFEVEKEELALLSAKREAERLAQQTAVIEQQLIETQHALQRIPANTEEVLATLRASLAALAEEKEQLELQGGYTLSSPVAGKVATVHVSSGDGVSEERTLLTILPEGETLHAQFFVPSRAIGFVSAGAPLNIMVEAFPYQQFGTRAGTVDQVSESVLLPSELPELGLQPNHVASEPAYRVVATLDQSFFSFRGKEYQLRPGMLISADIILEYRSILEWLLEPLLAVRNRL